MAPNPVITTVGGFGPQVSGFISYYRANHTDGTRPLGDNDNVEPEGPHDIDLDGHRQDEYMTVSETVAYVGWLLALPTNVQGREQSFLGTELWTRRNLRRNSPDAHVFGLSPATYWEVFAQQPRILQRHWNPITLPDRYHDNLMYWRYLPDFQFMNLSGRDRSISRAEGGILSYTLRWPNQESDLGGIYAAPDAELLRAANLFFASLQNWDRPPEANNPADQACLAEAQRNGQTVNYYRCDARDILRDAARAFVRWFQESDGSIRPYLFAGDQHMFTGRINHSYYFPSLFRFVFPIIDPQGPWAALADAYYLSMHEASAARLNTPSGPNARPLPLLPSNFVDFLPNPRRDAAGNYYPRYYEAGTFGGGGSHNESDFSWDAARVPLRVAEDLYFTQAICGTGNFPALAARYLTDPTFGPSTFFRERARQGIRGGYSHNGLTPADSSVGNMRLATTATIASLLLYHPDQNVRANAQQILAGIQRQFRGFWGGTYKYYPQQLIAQVAVLASPQESGLDRLLGLLRTDITNRGMQSFLCPQAASVTPITTTVTPVASQNICSPTGDAGSGVCISDIYNQTLGIGTLNRDAVVHQLSFPHLQHAVRTIFTALGNGQQNSTRGDRDAAMTRLATAVRRLQHDEENSGPDSDHHWPNNPYYLWSYFISPQNSLNQLVTFISAYSEQLMAFNRPYPEMQEAIGFCRYLRGLLSDDRSDYTNANAYSRAALDLTEAGLRLQIPTEGHRDSASGQVSLDPVRARAFYREGIELALRSIRGFQQIRRQVGTGANAWETSRPNYALIYQAVLTVADLLAHYQDALPPNHQDRASNKYLDLAARIYTALQNFNPSTPLNLPLHEFTEAAEIADPAITEVRFSWNDLQRSMDVNRARAFLSDIQEEEINISMLRSRADVLVRQASLVPQRQGVKELSDIFAALDNLNQAEAILRETDVRARAYNRQYGTPTRHIPLDSKTFTYNALLASRGQLLLMLGDRLAYLLRRPDRDETPNSYTQRLSNAWTAIDTGLARITSSHATLTANNGSDPLAWLPDALRLLRQPIVLQTVLNPAVPPDLRSISEADHRQSQLSCLGSRITREAGRIYRQIDSRYSYLFTTAQATLAEIGTRTGHFVTNEPTYFYALLPLAGAAYPTCEGPTSPVCAMPPRAFDRVRIPFLLAQLEVSFANNHDPHYRGAHLDRAERYLAEVRRLATGLDRPYPDYFRLQADLTQVDIDFSRARNTLAPSADRALVQRRGLALARNIACQFDHEHRNGLQCPTTPVSPYSFAPLTSEARAERNIMGFQPAALLAQVYQSEAIALRSWDYTQRSLFWSQASPDYYSRAQRPLYTVQILTDAAIRSRVGSYIRNNYPSLMYEEACRDH